MNSIIYEISSSLLDILKMNFQNDYSNIREVKTFWHNLNYLLISNANCAILSEFHDSIDLYDFEKYGLIPSSLIEFYKTNYDLIEDHIGKLTKQILQCGYPLELLREYMLCVELSVRKDSIELQNGKNSRDAIGSYYTPYELAKSIVKKVLSSQKAKDVLFKKGSIKIADLSCGGGEFLIASQEYLFEEFAIPYETSSTYFWGIDVDPIVLQITTCKFLLKAKKSDWRTIIGHFRVGNPLLSVIEEKSLDTKNKLFAINRFYSLDMGMNLSKNNFEGFDIILGNPPWEKIRFEERKFYKGYVPEISNLSKKNERAKAIDSLYDDWKDLYEWTRELSYDYSQINSQCYTHSIIKEAVSGELNTYALFTELCYKLQKLTGISALIVKSTLATAPVHKKLWTYLLSNGAIESLYFYENKKRIFNIDSRERFAVIELTKDKKSSFSFSAGLKDPKDILSCHEITINVDDIKVINPFTNMIPNIINNGDFEFLLKTHEKLPLFEEVYANCHFGRLVHLTAHSEYISKQKDNDNLPIYEGKFIEQYDARFSTFAGVADDVKYAAKASASKNELVNGVKSIPQSRFFIQKQFWDKISAQYPKKYSLCWRSLTSPSNSRTTIAMILPTCPTCQSIQMLQTDDNVDLIVLLGLFNSLPFDYFVRLKMPGIDLTQSVIKQIPVPLIENYNRQAFFNGQYATIKTHILSSVYRLIKKEELLEPLTSSIKQYIYMIDDSIPDEIVKKTIDTIFALAYQIDEETYKSIKKNFPNY